ncbi:MAG: hypothetical protein A2Z94_05710 [Gallionellales bacterium GWA2_55_18]|nr:MAG: hypothetical protein A2Z94_05710 [Gallionellales bacterium GWA2_55_18]
MAEGMMIRGRKAEDRGQRFCRGYAAQPSKAYRAATHNILSSVFCLLMTVFCLLSSALCQAEDLPDPTRLPAIIIPVTAMWGKPPPGLQSIIISKVRRAAIIDGETVELRGKHGDATLIEVSETGVVLQGAQGRQVLTLFPDVQIMQKEIQATPKLSEKEGGLAQKTELKARKERK